MEEIDIVIVGGGIAGLATSLALHRKGIKSVVMEREDHVRSEGGGIGILTNGWKALEQLRIAHTLRSTSLLIHKVRIVMVENQKHREFTSQISGEARCLKRNDLVRALADALPPSTIRFGSQIISIELDETTSFPLIRLKDGTTIKTKVLIGCDGANSMVADFLKLSPKKAFTSGAVRGFTFYPNGHGFPQELLRMKIGNVMCGRLPITNQLVYWFVVLQNYPKDQNVMKDHDAIAKLTLDSINEFSEDWKDMVRNCDVKSLTLTHLRYRAPWNIMFGKFRRGTVIVAGDAMHVMGPFLGQGGSAALEDAVVLARCLARKVGPNGVKDCSRKQMEEGLDEYVKERRTRLVGLSTQTYLTGHMLQTSSRVARLMLIILLIIIFGRSQVGHTRYDCGRL